MATEGELREQAIAAAEARTDTKIVRIEGKIDTLTAVLSGKMDLLASDMSKSRQNDAELRTEIRENKRAVLATVIGSAFALAALLVGIIVYGDAIFGRGMNVRDVVQTVTKEVLEQQKRAAPTPAPPAE